MNDDSPFDEEPAEIEKSNSSLSMLITIVLLIAGFGMAGTMMIHYGVKHMGEDGPSPTQRFNFSIADINESYSNILQSVSQSSASVAEEEHKTPSSKTSLLFGKSEGKVRWPKLELTGFGTATDNDDGFAIINGKPFHVNQLINDKVRVKEIRSQDVIVEYKGETKLLTMELQH